MNHITTLLAVFAVAVTAPSLACQSAPGGGSLSGAVIDETTGLSLVGATVTLEPADGGLLIGAGAIDSAGRTRGQVTGISGAYRFAGVVPGSYRLRVERIGYRSTTVEVEVLRPADARVSVGLELAPVALAPVVAERQAASLFQRSSNRAAELDDARRASERARQDLYLTPDARMVTYGDVLDGVTLGEGDIFRALQRFPGVGTRDDYTAEMWTRGAQWSHTHVVFDGVPLFNPLHAVGVLSAITPEVLGAVFFHPGVRPASIGGGAAGVVDLRSRPGAGDGSLGGSLDLSMASSKVTLEQNVENRGSWVFAARRSNLELLGGGMDWLGIDTLDLPFSFHDLAGRFDIPLSAAVGLEASGLWEGDSLHGDVEGLIVRNRADWGSKAGRVTLRTRFAGVELSHTLGASRFSARTDMYRVTPRPPAPQWTEPPSRNSLEHTHFAGQLLPVSAAAPRWQLGYEVIRQGGMYDGTAPRYYAVRPNRTERYTRDGAVSFGAVYGDARIELLPGLTVNPGLRVEVGEAFQNVGSVRPAPRVAVRHRFSNDHSISLAVGRSWQYGQAIALAGPSIHPAFHASQFWVWADDRTPALRADLATLGTELWLGHGWLGSATGYLRRTAGMALPDPTPGRLDDRPLFVPAENSARGAEASVRRIGSQWSASLGYSYGVSDVEAIGHVFPAPADRRHIFDAMAAARVFEPLRVALAYTSMSGAPFTRAFTRVPGDCSFFGFECGSAASFVEAPNAERTEPYASLDASAQWTRSVGSVELSAYTQIRNLLDRRNSSTYAGTVAVGRTPTRAGTYRIVWEDRFENGLPRLLLVGIRMAF